LQRKEKEQFKMNRKFIVLVFLSVFSLAAVRPAAASNNGSSTPSPSEDGTLPALAAVAGAGTMETHTYEYLEELSDDIGARVTGSPAEAQAGEWGLEKMKFLGLENVHKEPYQITRGWTRMSAEAMMIAPVHRRLAVDSLGWVGSTPAGGVESDIVPVNAYHFEEELRNNRASWRGKIILIVHRGPRPPAGPAEFAKFGAFLKDLQKAGAVAVIAGQAGSKAAGMRLTHTGALGFDEFFEIPVVSMAGEDRNKLSAFLSAASPCA
jgi:hypothetical protein